MSATDRFLYSGVSWATNAMPSSGAGDRAGRPPSTVTPPADGAARPTARCSSVVLPAPFGPISAATWQPQVTAAAARFAALPGATRHAWLGANLAALKAGRIALARIP